MSDILLLRHGKSDWSVGVDDFHRPLTNRGKRSAQRIGLWLQTHDLVPEHIWVSPAKRAMETAEKTIKVMGLPIRQIQRLPEMYEASSATVLEVITKARQNVGRTLIVGHNPGMELALMDLVAEQITDHNADKVMPTATLAHLSFTGNQVTLKHLIKPKTLPKQFPVPTEQGISYCDRPAYYYQQSGVLPFRWHEGGLQVLLITKSRKQQWGLPKGIIEPGYSPTDSAAKEAEEEAGVRGEVEAEPLGHYQHEKWGGVCHITLYPMKVTELINDDSWESHKRQRQWFTLTEAQQQISNPAIVDMLGQLAVREQEVK